MNIGIIGGGAIGLLFSAYLAETNDLTVYTRTNRQAESLNENGISLECNGVTKVVRVKANTLAALATHDILIMAVKQYHLKDVMQKVYETKSCSSILFLQNGMSHLKLLDSLHFQNILIGIVEHGAMKMKDGNVIHTGVGTTKISTYKGNDNDILAIFDNAASPSFSYTIEKNLLENMKDKLLINSCINPLTSLFRVKNGELQSNQFFLQSMKRLYDEVVSVIQIDDEERIWNQVIDVCTKTANNRSSMLRDIEEGRPTEIEAILGYVLEQAAIKGQTLKITSFVYDAIKGMEKRR